MVWSGFKFEDDIERLLTEGPFNMAFQPIVDTFNWKIFGYEALFRGTERVPVKSPEAFFRNECSHELVILDIGCVGSALRQGAEITRDGKYLFINVHASTMKELDGHKDLFFGLLKELGMDASKVVFEISERTDQNCAKELLGHLNAFTEQGIKIAIDDVGVSFNWLHKMLALRPDFLKVDKSFVLDISSHTGKRGMVKGLAMMSRHMGLKLIAEGIECPTALSTLKEYGVCLGQGFLIARPQPADRWLSHAV